MGIRGLTTYIEKRERNFFEDFALQDTHVIIDGRNLSEKLYRNTDCNDLFGGDYNLFVHYVFQFFNDLLQCNVKPLVILDGGWQKEKQNTMMSRSQQRMQNYVNRISGRKSDKIFPIFLDVVFCDVMRKMGIQYCMCIFEADNTISSISKILQVPVMSHDSDYFIYGVDYIPLNTLNRNIDGHAEDLIECRIFRSHKLLERFPGLDSTVLLLAYILLGNDYTKKVKFADFFRRDEFIYMIDEYEEQCGIETVFQWLKNHSLRSAVDTILSRSSEESRERIFQSIKNIVDGYFRSTTYMHRPLGIEQEINVNIHENFTPINDMNLYNNENGEGNNEENFLASVPQWFIDDLLAGRFPFYFVDILVHQIFIAPVQLEDSSKHPAISICTCIITKIFSLLITSRDNKANNKNPDIKQFFRKNMELSKKYLLSVPLSSVAFEDIRNLSVIERKKIIDDTLKIHTNDNLEELPPSWQLYVAVILFWMREDDEAERTELHLNALLMTMLIGIIYKNIGFKIIRSTTLNNITNMYGGQIYEEIIGDDKSMIMTNLINSVTEEDCTAAKPFFIDSHPTELYPVPPTFRFDIVHAYSQFQSCLNYAMDLNALLGDVYVQPSPEEFLDGATFYNFYIDFSTKSDVYEYIDSKLKNSDSLMKVFTALRKKIFGCLQNI